MSDFSSSAEGVLAHPVPLFASSWVALYHYLRHARCKAQARTISPKAEGRFRD
ncbi:MAG: hypothetical protein GTN86_00460 [Xanthomonadales bacterium]|nr:hypothetical protein [Xanthomonadales bacterium]NIN58282.1 hypothetical protein [Xanthomonadales bacterium]NIN73627.1 hypothetical protein [Xanthomonadales bacterium]NIO14412.1 hypothetical protein [Xanthomonadales bacterium]NIP10675.1 hypothetical protein [Xanthomonadales bacterium]